MNRDKLIEIWGSNPKNFVAAVRKMNTLHVLDMIEAVYSEGKAERHTIIDTIRNVLEV